MKLSADEPKDFKGRTGCSPRVPDSGRSGTRSSNARSSNVKTLKTMLLRRVEDLQQQVLTLREQAKALEEENRNVTLAGKQSSEAYLNLEASSPMRGHALLSSP